MCPLKEKCGKVKILRWPSSSIKSTKKFGKDCPYAHHPMELEFPETLKIRLGASKIKKAPVKPTFVTTGPLFDCPGGCSRCNLCKYKERANKVIKYKATIEEEKI